MSVKKIQILSDAETDLEKGKSFYEKQAVLPERRNPDWLNIKFNG